MSRLKNKVVVVTGGEGLLGKAIVSFLKSEEAIVISFDINQRNADKLNRIVDVTSEENVQNEINAILSEFGKIDGWVNNAYPRTSDWGNHLEDVSIDSWRKNIDLHLNSYFMCCKLILSHMKENKSGSLVNMSSIYGVVGPDFTVYNNTQMTNPVAYSAIKGGLINLSRYFSSYYGRHNVRINCISPGGIFDNQSETFVKNYVEKVPLGRMGKPSDIAPAVAFLLSDEASYITGQNLIIDGGWTAI
jgi:NAD(P)-dependent dehydrogenase (short-subunit alcohol dehydrogenase family)